MNLIRENGSLSALSATSVSIAAGTLSSLEGEAGFAALSSLFRRICLLRLRGRLTEADALHAAEFARTVQETRTRVGAALVPETMLRELYLREKMRVEDAAVLAELLTDLLPVNVSEPPETSLQSSSTATLAPASPSRRAAPEFRSSPRPSPETSETAPASRVSHSPPAIADLLDDMLAQDAKARRREQPR